MQPLNELALQPSAVWAIVPAKSLTEAKSRLAQVLSPDQRATLVLNLLKHTLQVLNILVEEQSLRGIIVVSSDPFITSQAEKLGGLPLLQSRPGSPETETDQLNQDLHAATTWAANQLAATQLLILPTDLPLLAPTDVREVLQRLAKNKAILVPDRTRQGTNALGLRTYLALNFDYRFGENSFAQHQAGLESRAIDYEVYERDSLAFDLDQAEDLNRLPKALRAALMEP